MLRGIIIKLKMIREIKSNIIKHLQLTPNCL